MSVILKMELEAELKNLEDRANKIKREAQEALWQIDGAVRMVNHLLGKIERKCCQAAEEQTNAEGHPSGEMLPEREGEDGRQG